MTTTHARYEVGVPGEVLDYYPSFREAERHAVEGGYIYDRMARLNKPQLWHVVNGDLIVQSVRLPNIARVGTFVNARSSRANRVHRRTRSRRRAADFDKVAR